MKLILLLKMGELPLYVSMCIVNRIECFSYWETGSWCYRRQKIGVLFYFGSVVVLPHC